MIPRNYVYICYSESYRKCRHIFWLSLYLYRSKNSVNMWGDQRKETGIVLKIRTRKQGIVLCHSFYLFSVMNYLKIQNLKFFFYGQKTFSIFSNICTNALITLHIIHNLKQIYQKSIIVKQIFIGQRVSIQQINPTRLGSWKFKWGGWI